MSNEKPRDLRAFLLDRVKPINNTRFVASKRFVDEDGNPIEWEIRPLSSAEDFAMKKGIWDGSDARNYMDIALDMAARATVFPDLRNTELQKSYNVTGEIELLKALLCVPGELYGYIDKVREVLGYDASPEMRIEEAKN